MQGRLITFHSTNRFFLRYPKHRNCLQSMVSDSQSPYSPGDMQPLSAFVGAGPMSYQQFLKVAVLLSRDLSTIHNSEMTLGRFDVDSVLYDGLGRVTLPLPHPLTGTIDEDLKSLGRVLFQLLTGGPFPENVDAPGLSGVYPPEARLTIEKLLDLHASGQFVSAAELHASLSLMRELHETADKDHQPDIPTRSTRLYLALSLVVLALILVWVILAVLRK